MHDMAYLNVNPVTLHAVCRVQLTANVSMLSAILPGLLIEGAEDALVHGVSTECITI